MNRELAPSWLPRQRRRHVDRPLRKLFHRNACSFCGEGFKHNHPSAAGFDAQGNVALAGECCFDRLAEVFGVSLYSDRQYDFFPPPSGAELPPERIAEAFAAYTKAIAETDRLLAGAEQRGGGYVLLISSRGIIRGSVMTPAGSNATHPVRTAVRVPFPGEIDEEAIKASAERALVMLIRQVEPGFRLRAVVELGGDFLPLDDDEATLHGLFEVGMGREAMPRDREALRVLAEKYTASRKLNQ